MASNTKLVKYLDAKAVKYEPIVHKTVYTAYDTAKTLKKELSQIAKSLLVSADKAYVIVVLPASMRLDMAKLKKAIGAKKISIPKESVVVKILKLKKAPVDAFGGMRKLQVVVDKSLAKSKEAIFNAGTFTDSVAMKVKDFIGAEEATVASFAASAGYKKAKASVKKMTAKKATSKTKTKRKPARFKQRRGAVPLKRKKR
ncbi:MAG: hypothetical protein COT81_01470 [Candidatus Buchananbacteria bacterium CG10_big_fil_rev_8_21_14_0_10_42_9]|uniref:YbaK/aminoacyl-tRNA synthetase-associated domain-containing protein n=1 Tax=Candidatus Buchananbacteria bacterium CG10_big_fil_rev_8_21_14_0_10_42_9 TaxID=1974526 RepID=A0A2H0W4D5_9BACT|nr:MAG: hypothetical protein COT81_01470 [Candidatus Buchananbacteria bacterium CG10_big_fil_rev_8_21_14_0_10_42_9]